LEREVSSFIANL